MTDTETCVLVVDDDQTLRDLLVDTLATIGYDAIPAESGEQALEILSNKACDVVISDVRMEPMDGVELLGQLRKRFPRLPVILITAVDSPEIIGRAAPDGFLPKPFRISAIEEIIEQVLQKSNEPAEPTGKRILIVDDDDIFREMLTDSLMYAGFTPTAVSSGQDALESIKGESFEAVVTDMKMPTMDGITLSKRIKDISPDTPIIIMTAFYSRSNIEQDSGALPGDRFIQKPFRIEELIALIDDLVPSDVRQ